MQSFTISLILLQFKMLLLIKLFPLTYSMYQAHAMLGMNAFLAMHYNLD